MRSASAAFNSKKGNTGAEPGNEKKVPLLQTDMSKVDGDKPRVHVQSILGALIARTFGGSASIVPKSEAEIVGSPKPVPEVVMVEPVVPGVVVSNIALPVPVLGSTVEGAAASDGASTEPVGIVDAAVVGIPVFAGKPSPISYNFRHFDEIQGIGQNYDENFQPILIDRSKSNYDKVYGSANSEIIGVKHNLHFSAPDEKAVFEILITNQSTREQTVRTMDTHDTYLRFIDNSWSKKDRKHMKDRKIMKYLEENFLIHKMGEIVKFSHFRGRNRKQKEAWTSEDEKHIRRINHGEVMFGGYQYEQHGEGICIDKVNEGNVVYGIRHCTTLDDIMQKTEVVTRNDDGTWEVQADEGLREYFGRKPDVTSAVLMDLKWKVSSLEQWRHSGKVMSDTPEERKRINSQFEEAFEFLHKAMSQTGKYVGAVYTVTQSWFDEHRNVLFDDQAMGLWHLIGQKVNGGENGGLHARVNDDGKWELYTEYPFLNRWNPTV
jgi:hypothetical protein